MNEFTFAKLARANVQALTPYQSARRIGGGTGSKEDIWLNANEAGDTMAYTIEKKIDEVVFNRFPIDALNRYSECQPPELIECYANYAQVKPEQVLVCRGADEGIDLLIRTFCEPQFSPKPDHIIYCPPTYGMYKIAAQIADVAYKEIPLTPTFELNIPLINQSLTKTKVKLIFICSPNNPTGNVVPVAQIELLLKKMKNKALIVIDEAYIDFCLSTSVRSLLKKYDNLVILRTLSKAFALAGLRCGFVLAHPEIIKLMLKVIAPYPISNPVKNIALHAFYDLEETKRRIRRVVAARKKMVVSLSQIKTIEVLPSQTNFLLFTTPYAQSLFEYLNQQGIILRKTPVSTSNGSGIRITIGTIQECQRTIQMIKSYIADKINETQIKTDKIGK